MARTMYNGQLLTNGINDNTASATTTYSSQKVDNINTTLNNRIDTVEAELTKSIDGTYNAVEGQLTLTWTDGNLVVADHLADGYITFHY